MRVVKIVAPSCLGEPCMTRGTKVVLPSGEVMPGVTKITLVAEVGDVWRAEIECLAHFDEVTALADDSRKFVRTPNWLHWIKSMCFFNPSRLQRIEHLLGVIMAKQSEAAADIRAVSEQLQKVGNETATLLQKITDLEAAIGDDASQELLDAVSALKAQAQVVDDLVPDAEPPTDPTDSTDPNAPTT